jgi:5,5'-dehydrodivanillate O-demethylase
MQFKPKSNQKFPWSDLFNWFVPIDDEHTGFFTARSAPMRGEFSEEFQSWLSSCDSYNPADFHEELFKGVMPDVDGNTINALQNAQDYIVQVGQGAIVDRSKEHLGKSDAGVILLRKIFRRELDASKKGQSGKHWKPRVGFAKLPVPPGIPLAPD